MGQAKKSVTTAVADAELTQRWYLLQTMKGGHLATLHRLCHVFTESVEYRQFSVKVGDFIDFRGDAVGASKFFHPQDISPAIEVQ